MTVEINQRLEHFTDAVAFERLSVELLTLAGLRGIDPQGVGRKDGGKDGLHVSPNGRRTVIHMSLRQDWKRKLAEDLGTTLESGERYDQIVFVTNRRVSAAAKDAAKAEALTLTGCTLEIFDQERLRALLATRPDICYNYFPGFVAASDVIGRLVSCLETMTQHGLAVPTTDWLHTMPHSMKTEMGLLAEDARARRFDEAIRRSTAVVETVRDLNVTLASGLVTLGGECFLQGGWVSAESLWQKALVVDPGSFPAAMNLAICAEYNERGLRYGRGSRLAVALERYESASVLARTASEEADCVNNMAAIRLREGQREEARRLMEEALRRCPSHFDSRLALLLLGNDLEQAWRLIQEETANVRNVELIRIVRVSLLVKEGAFGPALMLMLRFKKRREYILYDAIRMRIAVLRRRPQKAILYAKRVLIEWPAEWEAHLALGCAFEWLKDYSNARTAYAAAAEADDSRAEAFMGMAQVALAMDPAGGRVEAMRHMERALRRDPALVGGHRMLGHLYEEEGMFANAGAEYALEVAARPHSAEAHFNLAHASEYDEHGQRYILKVGRQKAKGHYRDALAISPTYFPALYNLGTLLFIDEEFVEAALMLERAAKVEVRESKALANLALVYERLGRLSDAENALRRALATDSRNVYAAANLERLMSRNE